MTQMYLRYWVHYYPADRWKLSFLYAYYFNKNVPELNQEEAPELRSAIQATYNFKHGRFKVNLRSRIEGWHFKKDDSFTEAVTRFRFQIKSIYPINSSQMQNNTLYVLRRKKFF